MALNHFSPRSRIFLSMRVLQLSSHRRRDDEPRTKSIFNFATGARCLHFRSSSWSHQVCDCHRPSCDRSPVHNQSKRMKEKRAVLDGVTAADHRRERSRDTPKPNCVLLPIPGIASQKAGMASQKESRFGFGPGCQVFVLVHSGFPAAARPRGPRDRHRAASGAADSPVKRRTGRRAARRKGRAKRDELRREGGEEKGSTEKK